MSRHETKILPVLTWRAAIGESDLHHTTRHVALALSLYMSEKGDSAHPGPSRLAKETGLCLRTVKTGLLELVDNGWLTVVERGGLRGKKRHANVYRALIPEPALPLDGPESTRAPAAPVQDIHPCNEDTRASHVTTHAPDAGVPVQDVHPISPTNSPGNSPSSPPTPPIVVAKKRRRAKPKETPEFVAFYTAYPRHKARADANLAWQTAITLVEPDGLIAAAESYRRSCEATGKDPDFIPYPASWLNGQRWTDEPDIEPNLLMLDRLYREGQAEPQELLP